MSEIFMREINYTDTYSLKGYKGDQYFDVELINFDVNCRCRNYNIYFHDIHPIDKAKKIYKSSYPDKDWNSLDEDIQERFVEIAKKLLRKQILENEKEKENENENKNKNKE